MARKKKLTKFRYIGCSSYFSQAESDDSGDVHIEGSGFCTFETLCGACDTHQDKEMTDDAPTCAGCLDVWNLVKNGSI